MSKVLMFHRILPKRLISSPNAYCDFGTLISQDYFEKVLQKLLDNNFQFTTVSDLDLSREKTIAITFDDGYADNFDYAVPILRKYNLTATFYPVINPCINNSVLPLDIYYQCVDEMQLSEGRRVDYIKGKIKKSFYWSEPIVQNKMLRELFSDISLKSRVEYLSIKQLKTLSCLGFEVGSHSMTHSLFTADYMNKDKIDFELRESKKILEKYIGQDVTSFCFPNGNYNAEIIKQAKDVGYKSVCVIKKTSEDEENVLPTYERVFVKPNSFSDLLTKINL